MVGLSSSPFVALTHEVEGTPVVKVCGDLDLLVADRFQGALEEAVRAVASGDVLVVDLSGVRFMDSRGVGAFVAATRRFVDLGGQVRLVVKQSPAEKTLRITGLDKVFSIYPDAASAAGRGVGSHSLGE